MNDRSNRVRASVKYDAYSNLILKSISQHSKISLFGFIKHKASGKKNIVNFYFPTHNPLSKICPPWTSHEKQRPSI